MQGVGGEGSCINNIQLKKGDEANELILLTEGQRGLCVSDYVWVMATAYDMKTNTCLLPQFNNLPIHYFSNGLTFCTPVIKLASSGCICA